MNWLTGKTGLALSVSTLVGLVGAAGTLIRDRIALAEELAARRVQLEDHEKRLSGLEVPGGRTVMAEETRRALAEVYRRLERLEEQRRP